MAEGDGVVYNQFKEDVLNQVHDFSNDTLKVTLHASYTPNIDTHVVWATTGVSSTEYSTASGYTAGGKTLGSVATSVNTSSDRAEVDCTDVTWTSLGPLSPATPGHAILWNDTPTSPADPLIGYWELGTTATNGGNYTLTIGANGFFQLT